MKAKKIVGVLLAFALAAVCFGCGEPKYSEVAAADYATTLASFESVATEVEGEKNFGYESTVKISMTVAGIKSESSVKMQVTYDAAGKVVGYSEVKSNAAGSGVTADINMKCYLTEGFLYMDVPEMLQEIYGGSKVKSNVGDAGLGELGNDSPTLNDILPEIFENTDSIAKLEISGAEGETRWLRVTQTKTAGTSTIELQVDKDNKFQSLKATMSISESGMPMTYEISMKRFTGKINLPDLSTYQEIQTDFGL